MSTKLAERNDLPIMHELRAFIDIAPVWMRPDAITHTKGNEYLLLYEGPLMVVPDKRASELRKNIQQYGEQCNAVIMGYHLPTADTASLTVALHPAGGGKPLALPRVHEPGPAEQSSFVLLADEASPPEDVADVIPEERNTDIPEGIKQLPTY